jgi:hypothetical protein
MGNENAYKCGKEEERFFNVSEDIILCDNFSNGLSLGGLIRKEIREDVSGPVVSFDRQG